MHFRRLELFGFKSFAERTKLEFQPGVTAIVGPNGCGKSNISDSIRWVLGEQSVKALRGSRMEDVIFNGTDSKEPINYAEVSLTLSNEAKVLPIEYDEVTITRRLYRSGESEYLLNKTPVRLKDITELIMGTGIGQSAYSLIEQGKIDQILSSKPEERREVFEEASGITKYKTKKKEAIRKLEETGNNLLRINDIIAEVKRQINSIERQANKAKRYKEEYEKLKDLEIRLGHIEFEGLNRELQSLEKEAEALITGQQNLELEIKNLKQELENLKASHNEQDFKKFNIRGKVTEIESQVFKIHSSLNLNRERMEELAQRKEALLNELHQTKERLALQEPELKNTREKLDAIDKDSSFITSILEEKERSLMDITKEIQENEEIISRSKLLLIDIAGREARYKTKLAKLSATLATSTARMQRLTIEKQNLLKEKVDIEASLSEKELNLKTISDGLNEIRTNYENKEQQNNELRLKLEELEKKIQDFHILQTQSFSKLDLLKEARVRYEGFSSGVRALLGSCNIESSQFNLRDVLANLIEVKSGYEECIEVALGEFLESIIVDSKESVNEAIRFLKENNAGKAQFIDLGSFRNYVNENIKSPPGHPDIIGKAVDFVKTDSKYQGLVNFLLKDTYIVKDIENLMEIYEKETINHDMKFVTLTGELIKGAIIKGGSTSKKDWGILNRDIKIKELTGNLEEINLRLEEFQKEKLLVKEQLSSISKDLALISAHLNEKEALLSNKKIEFLNLSEQFKKIREEEDLVESEFNEINSEIELLKNDEQEISKNYEQLTKENSLAEGAIKRSEGIVLEAHKKKETLLVEIAELKTRHKTILEQRSSLMNTIHILENSYNDSVHLFKSRSLEIESISSKMTEIREENELCEKQTKMLSEEKDSYLLELNNIEESLRGFSNTIASKNKTLLELESQQNNVSQTLHSKELRKNEVHFSIEGLTQRLMDIYKVDIAQEQGQLDVLQLDRGKIKEEIAEQKQKIDSMGTVNLVAIEEQKELQERFNFLTSQREDLLRARESLLKAISKINRTTRKLFIETFGKIRQEFKDYFRLLFGGGQGDLILMDESDVLECGIEIVAQPPGKRLQNISLLSGGERSLTAVALLFAIFKAKPSPFCVLDEIDATLDEANVDRFTRVLEDFVRHSQFIVITHNKKTIQMADVMYGITMEDSGVSKVVSVKFVEEKLVNG